MIKELSDTVLIDSSVFNKLKPEEQTEKLTELFSGKNIKFVTSITSFINRRSIIEKLLNGSNITLEIEAAEIHLTNEEKESLNNLVTIINKIKTVPATDYNYIIDTSYTSNLIFNKRNISTSCGQTIGLITAEILWKKFSNYWHNIDQQPIYEPHYAIAYGRMRHINVKNNLVSIGCQTFNRKDVEAAALHYGWEPDTTPIEI